MAIRAAIFDLDGTLLDTMGDIALAMDKTLTHFGYNTHSEQEYKLMVGTGAYDLVKKAVHTTNPGAGEGEITKILDYYKCLLKKVHAEGSSPPYDGVRETLELLSERGVVLAVISNKPDDAALAVVSRSLPGIPFAHVQGQRQGVPRKPDPSSLNAIMKSLGLQRDKAVYFGDSGVDMQTAKSAGLYAVGVLWGYRDKNELLREGADALIENPDGIVDFFN